MMDRDLQKRLDAFTNAYVIVVAELGDGMVAASAVLLLWIVLPCLRARSGGSAATGPDHPLRPVGPCRGWAAFLIDSQLGPERVTAATEFSS